MLRSALIILRKDGLVRLRDRTVWLFAFVIPLALAFGFSLVLPDQEDFHLRAGVVDLDGGEVSQGFTDELLPTLVERGFVTVGSYPDEQAARAAVEDDEVAVTWVLPAGLTEGVVAGEGGSIDLLANPDHLLSSAVARGIAEGFAAQIDRAALAVGTGQTYAQGALEPQQVDRITELALSEAGLVGIDELVAEHQRLPESSYLAAGMAIFFLFFTVSFGVNGFLAERQEGTLPRLLAAPLRPVAVHVAKAMGAFVMGVASMVVLAIASDLLLDAPWGPAGGVAVLIVAAVIAALGVMVLVASFARTAEQSGNLLAIVAMILGISGGVFFPVGTGLMGTLALASPHGWFLRGLGDLAGSGNVTAVLPAAGVLVAFGVVAAIPGAIRIERWGHA
jgi:ABC-2 type transport system permease protein